jgi:hypothetical protein
VFVHGLADTPEDLLMAARELGLEPSDATIELAHSGASLPDLKKAVRQDLLRRGLPPDAQLSFAHQRPDRDWRAIRAERVASGMEGERTERKPRWDLVLGPTGVPVVEVVRFELEVRDETGLLLGTLHATAHSIPNAKAARKRLGEEAADLIVAAKLAASAHAVGAGTGGSPFPGTGGPASAAYGPAPPLIQTLLNGVSVGPRGGAPPPPPAQRTFRELLRAHWLNPDGVEKSTLGPYYDGMKPVFAGLLSLDSPVMGVDKRAIDTVFKQLALMVRLKAGPGLVTVLFDPDPMRPLLPLGEVVRFDTPAGGAGYSQVQIFKTIRNGLKNLFEFAISEGWYPGENPVQVRQAEQIVNSDLPYSASEARTLGNQIEAEMIATQGVAAELNNGSRAAEGEYHHSGGLSYPSVLLPEVEILLPGRRVEVRVKVGPIEVASIDGVAIARDPNGKGGWYFPEALHTQYKQIRAIGMRSGELVAVGWEAYDPAAGVLKIDHHYLDQKKEISA